MPARLGIGWLDALAHSACADDAEWDDLDDWLAGNDDALTRRVSDRKRALIIAAGGEIG